MDEKQTSFLNRISELSIQEITSEEFFDELFSVEEFKRLKYKLDIENRCKEIGLTKGSFDKLYKVRESEQKEILKSMKRGFFEGEGNVLDFGDDVPQLSCGMWVANKEGIFLDTVSVGFVPVGILFIQRRFIATY